MKLILIFVLTFCLGITCIQALMANQTRRTPVILVPGDGGSQIYSRYMKRDLLCPGGSEWFLIWVNLEFLLPLTEYCLARYLKLGFNVTNNRTYDQPGVETRTGPWGNTSSVEYLDTRHYGFLSYYGAIVSALVQNGYTRNVDIRAAPYDFRKAPNENNFFVPMLKKLVEQTYHQNNATRVMLVDHSMGNLYTMFFLRHMSSAWKKTYIRGFFSISAPIGGAVKSIRAETSGDSINSAVFFLRPVRDVQRSMPSTVFLFPSSHFWKSDEVIAMRPSRNYTVANYKQLFIDIPYPNGWAMYQEISTLVDPLWVPDVDELYCAHGISVPTPEVFQWTTDSSFPESQPYVKYGDGDGTVNIRSLHGCLKWPGVVYSNYSGAEHVSTLSDIRLINHLINVLTHG